METRALEQHAAPARSGREVCRRIGGPGDTGSEAAAGERPVEEVRGLVERRRDDIFDPTVRVVLSSGYGRDGRAQEILDEGALEILQKPCELQE